MTRLPVEPLFRVARSVDTRTPNMERDNTVSTLAELLHLSSRTVRRWKEAGVPVEAADRVAVALGLHPSAVWPVEWWAA